MKEIQVQTTRVAAYGLIKQERKILLCRISELVPRCAGQWTLPGGGVEFGESPQEAMVREVMEETGLLAAAVDVAGIDSIVAPNKQGLRHSIRIIYYARHQLGELMFEQDGSTDRCQWFSEDEAKALPLLPLAGVGLELAYQG